MRTFGDEQCLSSLPSNRQTPYVEQIERLLDLPDESVEIMVIGHNDPGMIRRVREALPSGTLILQMPQTLWECERWALSAAMTKLMESARTPRMVCIVHSQSLPVEPELSIAKSGASRAATKENSVFEAARFGQEQIDRAKANFNERFRQLKAALVDRDRGRPGVIEVYGLFYVTETGVFLILDEESGAFHPLA